MRVNFSIFILAASLLSCSTPKQTQLSSSNQGGNRFTITEVSTDETYGYTEKNPVKVGGGENGPANERKYLNSITGPNGEQVRYERKGSCCVFKTSNGFMGGGLLDKYEVTYAGLSEPIIIYINMYDKDELKAPKGFKFKE